MLRRQLWLPLILLLFVPFGVWAILYALIGDVAIASVCTAISVLIILMATHP